MSTPFRMTEPEVGFSKPASMRSRVDLPQPELPSRANISPLRIASDTSSTAITASKRLTSCRVCRKPPLCESTRLILFYVALFYLAFLKSVNTLLIDSRPALIKLAGDTIFFMSSASRNTVLSFAISGLTALKLNLLAVG